MLNFIYTSSFQKLSLFSKTTEYNFQLGNLSASAAISVLNCVDLISVVSNAFILSDTDIFLVTYVVILSLSQSYYLISSHDGYPHLESLCGVKCYFCVYSIFIQYNVWITWMTWLHDILFLLLLVIVIILYYYLCRSLSFYYHEFSYTYKIKTKVWCTQLATWNFSAFK